MLGSARAAAHGRAWAAQKLLCGGGGGGMASAPGEGEGGERFHEMGFRAGPLCCVRPDVAAEGAGTQILARKIFFTKKSPPPPHMCSQN